MEVPNRSLLKKQMAKFLKHTPDKCEVFQTVKVRPNSLLRTNPVSSSGHQECFQGSTQLLFRLG